MLGMAEFLNLSVIAFFTTNFSSYLFFMLWSLWALGNITSHSSNTVLQTLGIFAHTCDLMFNVTIKEKYLYINITEYLHTCKVYQIRIRYPCFLAPTGAQGVKMCVRASVCVCVRDIMLQQALKNNTERT